MLLAQALFSNPDILLLDEPTNNLDINTIRWLEDVLNERNATIIIISHDRHFLNQVCTHMADLDFGTIKVYPGNYDDYMLASTQATRTPGVGQRQGQGKGRRTAGLRAPLLGQRVEGQPGHQPREARSTRSRSRTSSPVSRQNPYIRFEHARRQLHRRALEVEKLKFGYDGTPLFSNLNFSLEAGEKMAVIGGNGVGKIHADEAADGRAARRSTAK